MRLARAADLLVHSCICNAIRSSQYGTDAQYVSVLRVVTCAAAGAARYNCYCTPNCRAITS